MGGYRAGVAGEEGRRGSQEDGDGGRGKGEEEETVRLRCKGKGREEGGRQLSRKSGGTPLSSQMEWARDGD